MDPNAALEEIRALIAASEPEDLDDRLVELIEGLDGWLTRGGFLPRQWARGQVVEPAAHSVTLVFDSAEEMLDTVDYLGDEDAPVFLSEDGEVTPIRVGSVARVSGREFSLWGEFNDARMALVAEREAAENG